MNKVNENSCEKKFHDFKMATTLKNEYIKC